MSKNLFNLKKKKKLRTTTIIGGIAFFVVLVFVCTIGVITLVKNEKSADTSPSASKTQKQTSGYLINKEYTIEKGKSVTTQTLNGEEGNTYILSYEVTGKIHARIKTVMHDKDGKEIKIDNAWPMDVENGKQEKDISFLFPVGGKDINIVIENTGDTTAKVKVKLKWNVKEKVNG